MSSPTHIPNLITQVQRPDESDEEYDGGISARGARHDESDEDLVVVSPKPSLLQRICCCFFPSQHGTDSDKPPIGEGHRDALLPAQVGETKGRHCLVLDLDETLVHSSFKPISSADFIIPVEIEDQVHQVYVSKRPGVDEFMREMGKYYEVVVFTASLAKYADPVLDLLDIHKVVHHRLFRDACTYSRGSYVKDLSRLGRTLNHTLIIDNSPASFMFHPEYAIAISTWFDDPSDTELDQLTPFLIELSKADDVRILLSQWASGTYGS